MSSITITITKAQERDVSVLTELSRFVHDLHVEAHPEYFKPFEPGAISEEFGSRLRRSNVRVFIAWLGELPLGYALAGLSERAADARCLARRFYAIEEIAVSPLHRQRGVARALVERVLAEARSLGIEDVELTSWSFNHAAHAAFEALGFRSMVVRFRCAGDDRQ
ncbi:MAG TPA: GNAT family N-acetyltransferase [Polyangiaceae bacterium]